MGRVEKPPRAVHVINDLRVGGAERLLTDLAPRLRDAGAEVRVVALGNRPDSFLQESLTESGVAMSVPAAPVPMRSPAHVRRLAEAIRGADVVHVHLFPAQLWTALAVARLPRAARPFLVTTEHNTTNGRRGKALLRPLDAWMYGRCARIVAISPATADALGDWCPGTRARTVVIPNGVDVDAIAAAPTADRAAIGLPPDARVVACTGRFEEQKDQATLIRALSRLPADVHAVFLGDGPRRPAAEALAASLGVAERTHFGGVRGDVPAILKACDAYAQPSRWEGFGVAVVEAMAAGLPCVVSDVPGVREVAAGAGLTFPAGADAALADALRTVLNDDAAASRLREAGRRRAAEFGMERYVAAHLSLYHEVRRVSGRRAGP